METEDEGGMNQRGPYMVVRMAMMCESSDTLEPGRGWEPLLNCGTSVKDRVASHQRKIRWWPEWDAGLRKVEWGG